MAYTPYQMKGPSLYKKGDKKSTEKKKKTFEDYMEEGFSPEEARQMAKDGATTGESPLERKKDAKYYRKEASKKPQSQKKKKNYGPTQPTPPPTAFLGKLAKGIGKFAGGVIKGKDGKFGVGDVGRLALGPMGAVAGGLGLFKKGKKPINFNSTMDLNEDRYGPSAGETVAMNKFKFTKNNKKSKTKNY